jgi:hypothetical protein
MLVCIELLLFHTLDCCFMNAHNPYFATIFKMLLIMLAQMKYYLQSQNIVISIVSNVKMPMESCCNIINDNTSISKQKITEFTD